jgi:hypothetical protein
MTVRDPRPVAQTQAGPKPGARAPMDGLSAIGVLVGFVLIRASAWRE